MRNKDINVKQIIDSMETYKHFLFTRFNIIQDWYLVANRNNVTIQTDEWLKKRIFLFEKYCLPSVMHQKDMNFEYLVLFNLDSPNFLKAKIEEWKNKFSNFYPLYLQPDGDEDHLVRTTVKNMKGNASWVITSRLDSDDMISSEYMEYIHTYIHTYIRD